MKLVRRRGARRAPEIVEDGQATTIVEVLEQAWERSGRTMRSVRGVSVKHLLAGRRPIDLPALERFAEATGWDPGIDLAPAAIGEQLRTARELAGLSQVEAAAGIFQPKFLSLVELGKKRCSIAKLQELARRVDCDLGPVLSLPPGGRHLPPPGHRTATARPADDATPLPEVDSRALGAQLRGLRTGRALTLIDVAGGNAGLAGVLGRYERGEELPSIRALLTYAEALEVDLGVTMEQNKLGHTLQRQRRALGMSLETAAAGIGGVAYLRHIEAGEVTPRLEVFLKLSYRLGLDVGPVLGVAMVAPNSPDRGH